MPSFRQITVAALVASVIIGPTILIVGVIAWIVLRLWQ